MLTNYCCNMWRSITLLDAQMPRSRRLRFEALQLGLYTSSIQVGLSHLPDSTGKSLRATGHSMIIVGFEKCKDGTLNLLVFDPMFHDPSNVVKLIGKELIQRTGGNNLRAYRRSVKCLRKYNEFEILKYVNCKRSRKTLNSSD